MDNGKCLRTQLLQLKKKLKFSKETHIFILELVLSSLFGVSQLREVF